MKGELNKDEKGVRHGTESAPVAPLQWMVRIGAPIKAFSTHHYPRTSTHTTPATHYRPYLFPFLRTRLQVILGYAC